MWNRGILDNSVASTMTSFFKKRKKKKTPQTLMNREVTDFSRGFCGEHTIKYAGFSTFGECKDPLWNSYDPPSTMPAPPSTMSAIGIKVSH